MNFKAALESFWIRLLLATILWFVFWPLYGYLRTGVVFGPKAFFWTVGAFNYPVTWLVFIAADQLCSHFRLRSWLVFFASVLIVCVFMFFFFPRGGFSMGALLSGILF